MKNDIDVLMADLMKRLEYEGAFDYDKWNFHIYKESIIDEWNVAHNGGKRRVVYGTGDTLEEALLMALCFVLKAPKHYKGKTYKK